MTELRKQLMRADNSPSIDAFGRWRTSSSFTEFDSKQLYDNQPLFWQESLETGAGITSAHSAAKAATTITSTLETAGKFTRQTYMSFNYQPGKSKLILMTGVLDETGGGTGVERRIGQFNDQNGLFFADIEGVVNVVRRTYVTGSAVDNAVPQTSWNLDRMNGAGGAVNPSGITVDWTKTQIFIFDYEWLGVGRVRMGLNIDGCTYYVHEFLNANVLATVYMSSPNLPLRYQMITTASSPASSMMAICSSVSTESGVQDNGILRHFDSAGLTALSAGTTYAAIGIKLKSAYIGTSIAIENVSMIATTKDDQFHWELKWNPSVAGTFTYADQTNSAVQTVAGVATNIVTNGYDIDGGYGTTSVATAAAIKNALRLGATIAGVQDEFILCIRPITNNISVNASITWRELS